MTDLLIPALAGIETQLNRWLADRDYLRKLRNAIETRQGTTPATEGLAGLMLPLAVVEAAIVLADANIKLLRRQKKISAVLAENSAKLGPVLEPEPRPTPASEPKPILAAIAPSSHARPAKA